MSLAPKLKRILLPPSIPPSPIVGSKGNVVDIAETLLSAQLDLNSAISKVDISDNVPPVPPLQRHMTLHPSKPLVAYILNPADVSIAQNTNKIIVVQNIVTKQIIFSISWTNLAAILYNETDVKKLPLAAKSLGIIHSLQFYDPAVLYWSRVLMSIPPSSALQSVGGITNDRFQSLAVQTDKRIIILDLRSAPASTQVFHTSVQQSLLHGSNLSSKVILAHLCEKTIGAVPSSNILPLTNRWVLLGCVDGSMKCFDWTTGTTVKKIKGLGKGDWIVKLLSANRFHTETSSPTSQGTIGLRRILTVTKKGIVYLIEIELDMEKNIMDIQPPLGRFYIGSPVEFPAVDTSSSGDNIYDSSTTQNVTENMPIMEHCIISYDAHMDRLYWLTPRNKQTQTLSVWNLRSLHQDFLQQANLVNSSGSSSKNLFKPDPTLVIQFPTTSLSNTVSTAAIVSVHPSFAADTVVCVTLSNTGDLYIHGAVALAANTTQTVFATPVHGVNLTQLLGDSVPSFAESNEARSNYNTIVRVLSAACQPLPSTGCSEMCIATNVGIFIIEFPMSMIQGTHHCHFGAGLGSLGKSILMVHNSFVEYASVDSLTVNPVGFLEPKNPAIVYECQMASHMPTEFQKRPFRFPPIFLTSPSGLYVCLLWSFEFRYEIVHIPTVLAKLTSRAGPGGGTAEAIVTNTRSIVVASGSGVIDFAWVGDEDVYCILYGEDLMEQASNAIPKDVDGDGTLYCLNPVVKAPGMNVATLATSVTKSGAKLATSATVNATMTVTTAANKTVEVATQGVRTGAKVVTKGVKNSFKMFGVGGKKKKSDTELGSSIATDDDDDFSEAGSGSVKNFPTGADIAELENRLKNLPQISEVRGRSIELSRLESSETFNASEQSGTNASVSVIELGELSLRGGKRMIPSAIFGGPVLCVASLSENGKEGQAYFYTRKTEDKNCKALSYVVSEPTLPRPDIVVWDDEGRLCAIVVSNRVMVYLSEVPNFVLLGSVRISSPVVGSAKVTSLKFVHGVLYCCTWDSIHCILLSDLDAELCKLDSYILASTNVVMIPERVVNDTITSFAPCPIYLPLANPTILGYQSGSLLLSTSRGIQAIPLSSPLLRIGLLLASGQVERATKWFDAVSLDEHEELALFLERRGRPELSMQLPGLSLETIIDISIRFGYVDRIEDIAETYGAGGLKAIDDSSPKAYSTVVSVGAYLFAYGRIELTRRLATECLRLGDEGKKDALLLGTLLLSVDNDDAIRLMTRAVEEGPVADNWLIGKYVRDHVLRSRKKRSQNR